MFSCAEHPSYRCFVAYYASTFQWRHNELAGVPNHQPHDCLLNRLFRRKSKKTSKLRVTGLCVGNSPVTVEFPAQRASSAENVSIWWRHHECRAFMFHFVASLSNINQAMNWRVKFHDDVIKWKRFPHYWPFVKGIHWSLVDSHHIMDQ